MNRHLHLWEKAALAALCLTLLLACRVQGERDALARSVVRLHVIAASDAPEEQAQKLLVRDAVLAYLAPLLEGADSKAEAEERLNRHLTSLRTRLCVIPLDSGEALCYECLCALGEDRYLIYVDALSGEERRIYKIVEDENGALAI